MRTGRPSKLTPELTKAITELVRAGNYIETAAAANGINKDTLFRWLKKGKRQKRGKFKDFSDSVNSAMGRAEVSMLGVIAKAAVGFNGVKGQWQAAAWYLERTRGERFAQKSRVDADVKSKTEVSGPNGEPLTLLHNSQLLRIIDIAKALPDGEPDSD